MKLEIRNLSVHLDDQPILRNVSLEVADGEFVSLLGPSGCGKTTMLKTIAGLLPMGDGKIFLGEQEVSRVPTHRRGAVVVFQDLRMFPHMTAAENVAFPLKMQGVPKKERLKIAAEFLRRKSIWRAGKISRYPRCPVASSSVWLWPVPWRHSRSCCCWMNPFRPWMKISGRRCAGW